jgi:hypothetical protein
MSKIFRNKNLSTHSTNIHFPSLNKNFVIAFPKKNMFFTIFSPSLTSSLTSASLVTKEKKQVATKTKEAKEK